MDVADILQLTAGPTTPCRLSGIESQHQLLFRVGIMQLLSALLACLLYLVHRVDDLFFKHLSSSKEQNYFQD